MEKIVQDRLACMFYPLHSLHVIVRGCPIAWQARGSPIAWHARLECLMVQHVYQSYHVAARPPLRKSCITRLSRSATFFWMFQSSKHCNAIVLSHRDRTNAYEFVADCVDMMILTPLAHLYNLVGWLRLYIPPPPVCVLCSGLIQPKVAW